MNKKFYDKVAQKFGGYHSERKHIVVCPKGDPEVIFKQKLLNYSNSKAIVLDVGCADGHFTASIAPLFFQMVGIDLSKEMLSCAEKLLRERKIKNIRFQEMDASRIDYPDETFDVVYSRRGPIIYSEFYRLLKPLGILVEIEIGDQDCREIKEVFKRGQNYGEWNTSVLKLSKAQAVKIGFKSVFVKEYFCTEYYSSLKELDLFLQGVPIFEDFDSDKDNRLLKRYVSSFKTIKGICLPRHRVVSVYQKI